MKRRIESYGHAVPYGPYQSSGNIRYDVGSVYRIVDRSSTRRETCVRLSTTGYVENPFDTLEDAIGKSFRLLRVQGSTWVIEPLYPDCIAMPEGL